MHSPSIYDEVVKDESTQELHRAIDKLKYEQRVALTLHYFDDMSYKEVAEIMEISLSKVETLIFRAKKNLKKMLVENTI